VTRQEDRRVAKGELFNSLDPPRNTDADAVLAMARIATIMLIVFLLENMLSSKIVKNTFDPLREMIVLVLPVAVMAAASVSTIGMSIYIPICLSRQRYRHHKISE